MSSKVLKDVLENNESVRIRVLGTMQNHVVPTYKDRLWFFSFFCSKDWSFTPVGA